MEKKKSQEFICSREQKGMILFFPAVFPKSDTAFCCTRQQPQAHTEKAALRSNTAPAGRNSHRNPPQVPETAGAQDSQQAQGSGRRARLSAGPQPFLSTTRVPKNGGLGENSRLGRDGKPCIHAAEDHKKPYKR